MPFLLMGIVASRPWAELAKKRVWFEESLMPFIPSNGSSGVGAMRGSCMTIREAPVVVSMTHTAPKVESEASKVVGLRVVRPLRKTASFTMAVRLISGGLEG